MLTTFERGRKAEAVAARFLIAKGCTIIAQNWRTRRCEIDIVAFRNDIIYICEVKYRVSCRQGHGLDYITPNKLRQLHFAAQCWIATSDWSGDYQLAAIEVSGVRFIVTDAVHL